MATRGRRIGQPSRAPVTLEGSMEGFVSALDKLLPLVRDCAIIWACMVFVTRTDLLEL